jgi:hypothetical protein
MWDLKFSRRWKCRCRSSGLWRPCGLVGRCQCFGDTYLTALKMETVCFFETLVSTYKSTRRHNPDLQKKQSRLQEFKLWRKNHCQKTTRRGPHVENVFTREYNCAVIYRVSQKDAHTRLIFRILMCIHLFWDTCICVGVPVGRSASYPGSVRTGFDPGMLSQLAAT